MSSLLKEKPFLCRIVELILCIVAVGLIIKPFNNGVVRDMNRAAFIYISLGGFVLINGAIVVCYFLKEEMTKKMSMIFSILGAVFCLTAGAVLIYDWNDFPSIMSNYMQTYLDQMIASGIFAILAAVAFVVDIYFTNKT